jgi:hypothetical protein
MDIITVYLGKFTPYNSKKRMYLYAEMSDAYDGVKVPESWLEQSAGDNGWFFNKSLTPYAQAGDICRLKCDDDKTGFEVIHSIDDYLIGKIDESQRIQLQAYLRAIETKVKSEKDLKKNQIPVDLENLKPFQEAYRTLSYQGRQALISNIIEYITR